jgi:hypothetical protein
MTTVLLGILMMSLLLAPSADVSGVWTLDFDPDFSGNRGAADCTFKQEGRKLNVTCGGVPTTGAVEGQRVNFEVKTGKNNELTARFVAALDAKGTRMTGTWRLQGKNGKFTATRH